MKGCLKFFVGLVVLMAIIGIFSSKKETAPTPAVPTHDPTNIASTTRSTQSQSSPTPRPFPLKKAWPEKCHLIKPAELKSSVGGGAVSMTLPANTEVFGTLSSNRSSVLIKAENSDLQGEIPLQDTDFLQLAEQKAAQMDEEARRAVEKAKAEEAKKVAAEAAEKAAYGPEPDFYDGGPFGITIPSVVKEYLKKTAKDPASIQIREKKGLYRTELNGLKCWQIEFIASGKNGFGGNSFMKVDAWLWNGNLVDIKIHQE